MTTEAASGPRITSFAPQLLVDDLDRAIAFYRDVLGFAFGEPWGGFYAIGVRDGLEIHLKCAPKAAEDRANRHEHGHLDIYSDVNGVDALYASCTAKGATILKPLAPTPWGTKDFYLEDPDGYIIAFGEILRTTADAAQ
jgi:catechol 2,3-dioxygenase-like lactoylglutathione lyase family enzyme